MENKNRYLFFRTAYVHTSTGKSEKVVNICLFSVFLIKITFLTRKQNNCLLFYVVTTVTTCFQWTYAFSTELLALRTEALPDIYLDFNILKICDPQDAYSEGRWGRSHLVRYQGCIADVRNTPIHIAATRLPSVGLCGGLGTKWLPSLRPPEEASWWSQTPHLYTSAGSCPTVVPFAKSRILCWRHW